jgi:hypothetical protein
VPPPGSCTTSLSRLVALRPPRNLSLRRGCGCRPASGRSSVMVTDPEARRRRSGRRLPPGTASEAVAGAACCSASPCADCSAPAALCSSAVALAVRPWWAAGCRAGGCSPMAWPFSTGPCSASVAAAAAATTAAVSPLWPSGSPGSSQQSAAGCAPPLSCRWSVSGNSLRSGSGIAGLDGLSTPASRQRYCVTRLPSACWCRRAATRLCCHPPEDRSSSRPGAGSATCAASTRTAPLSTPPDRLVPLLLGLCCVLRWDGSAAMSGWLGLPAVGA